MKIKILGSGCQKCKTLEKMTLDAVNSTGVSATVEKVEDIMKILEYNVIQTPGLVIDEKVIITGRIPSIDELKRILLQNQT